MIVTQHDTHIHFVARPLEVGYNHICDPEDSPLRWLHFGRLWLPEAGQSWTHTTGEREETLTLLHGSGALMVSDGTTFSLGPRSSPFNEPPTMVHLPAQCEYTIVAGRDGLDAALAAASAEPGGMPLLFPAETAQETTHGTGMWKRKIYLGTVGDYPIQRIQVGETLNRPGGWTSFPPHKHDVRNPPLEMPYEEIYFFFVQPTTGFGIQYVYDGPQYENGLNTAIVVRDGDTVVIPHGYHPVAGMPGHRMYYLWILCGEVGERSYGQFTTDPHQAWLVNVEPLQEQ